MVGEDTKKTGEHMQRSRGMYEEPEDRFCRISALQIHCVMVYNCLLVFAGHKLDLFLVPANLLALPLTLSSCAGY